MVQNLSLTSADAVRGQYCGSGPQARDDPVSSIPGSRVALLGTVIDVQVPGRVVLLNGPSSSGKSSIGRAMLPLLEDPWFFMPVDALSALRSTVHRRRLDDTGTAEMLRRTRLGYHRAVAALASVGNDVIMDYPLSEPWRLLDLLEVLVDHEVTLVDVVCDPDELVRRERLRGDRPPGLAASQHVFTHADRDLTVDTTATTPEECAASIVRHLEGDPGETAFDRLRKRLSDGSVRA